MKHEHKLQIPEETKEEIKARFYRVKRHFRANRTTYLVGAGCLAAGYLLRKPTVITVVNEGVAPVVPAVINNVAPVFNNDNSSVVNFGGHTTKLVKRLSDGKIWESMTEAATEEGYSLSRMSNHLNGRTEHLNGKLYKFVGIRTAG